jgi:hypothetical protein
VGNASERAKGVFAVIPNTRLYEENQDTCLICEIKFSQYKTGSHTKNITILIL